MTPIVLKSKADAQNLKPLVDGAYKISITYFVTSADPADPKVKISTPETKTNVLNVSKGVYSTRTESWATFDKFKEGLIGEVFAEGGSTKEFTIEDVAATTATTATETPWLLYAGGALLLWLVLSKK